MRPLQSSHQVQPLRLPPSHPRDGIHPDCPTCCMLFPSISRKKCNGHLEISTETPQNRTALATPGQILRNGPQPHPYLRDNLISALLSYSTVRGGRERGGWGSAVVGCGLLVEGGGWGCHFGWKIRSISARGMSLRHGSWLE